MTEQDFLALEGTNQRIELLDGEIVLAPSPSPEHQDCVFTLGLLLRSWARANPPAYVGLSPLDVRLSEGRIVQPDLFVFLHGRPTGPRELIRGVPDLVVEVMSDRKGYDRLTKRLIYAEAGVMEYWVIDPYARTLELIRGLATERVVSDRLADTLLSGFECSLPRLFED